MSELQISLLAIGILVVAAVYGYGTWQQRQYRNRFGAAFKAQAGDALYQGVLARQSGGLPSGMDEEVEHLLPDDTGATGEPEESCKTLDPETDYIAVMFASSPLAGSILAPLWQRRFDYGKRLHVCGVRTAGGPWEKVVAENHLAYETFRLALQLADRSGAVTEARLSDFRDLLRDIAEGSQAEVNLPSAKEAADSARRLDAFCAEVDQMIGLNILPDGQHLLPGADVAKVAQRHGMTLRADGAFHLLDSNGNTLYTLSNFDGAPFQHHELDETPVIGLSLQLDVPRVEQPARRFQEMAVLARAIGEDLGAAVVDDHRKELNDAAVAMIRAQVAGIEKKMLAYPIAPGGALARRLFS